MWYLKSLYLGFVKAESDNSLDHLLSLSVVTLLFLQHHLVLGLLGLLVLLRLFVREGKNLKQKRRLAVVKEEKELKQKLEQCDSETLQRLVKLGKAVKESVELLGEGDSAEVKLSIVEEVLKERNL